MNELMTEVKKLNSKNFELNNIINENNNILEIYNQFDDFYLDVYENNNNYLIDLANISNDIARLCAENNQINLAYDFQTLAFNCLNDRLNNNIIDVCAN